MNFRDRAAMSATDGLTAHLSRILEDARVALSDLPKWERPVHIFWLAGPFILLIERSPADLWLSVLALTFAIRSSASPPRTITPR